MTTARGIIGLLVVAIAIVALTILIANSVGSNLSPRRLAAETLNRFDSPADPKVVVLRDFAVREGDTANDVASRLEDEGLIENALVFRLMGELDNSTGDIAAGDYELSPSMRPSEILEILVKGRTKPASLVTIPEGWRAEEIAEKLETSRIGSAERFMELVRSYRPPSGAAGNRPAGSTLEGYLFPNTYSFTNKTTMDEMVSRMVEQLEVQFTPEIRQKAAALGMSTHEVVTLASIIEREAVVPAERPLMAAVFYNRLKGGMKLQTDPTVQYAIANASGGTKPEGGWWKSNLSQTDLTVDSPYNTYVRDGLPPGPICNPGMASLLAVVEPAASDYLYFVARPDGSHAFAETLEAHNENVARYRP